MERAWSAPSELVGSASSEIFYSAYLLYESRTALLQAIFSPRDSSLSLFHWHSLNKLEGLASSEGWAGKVVWKRLGAVNHIVRLRTYEVFNNLCALFFDRDVYTRDDGKQFLWKVRQ